MMIEMLIFQEWLRDKIKNDPDLYQEVGIRMLTRIIDRYGKPWFYQFGNLYGSLRGESIRHIDDILRHAKE